jgi:hypothetical protein
VSLAVIAGSSIPSLMDEFVDDLYTWHQYAVETHNHLNSPSEED